MLKLIKKHPSVLSAILIAVASFGFLLVPELYDDVITNFEQEISTLQDKQTKTGLDLVEAIHHKGLHYLNQEHLIIMKGIGIPIDLLKEKEKFLIESLSNAAIWSINASRQADVITNEKQLKLTNEIENSENPEYIQGVFVEYLSKAGKGTYKLDSLRTKLTSELSNAKTKKKFLWYLFFLIQSIGLILSILSITILKEKNVNIMK